MESIINLPTTILIMSTETAARIPSEHTLGVSIVGLSAAGGWVAGAHVRTLAHLPGSELRGPWPARRNRRRPGRNSCAYSRIHADLTHGTDSAPTFAHAVRRHRLLARVHHNAQVE